MSNIHLITTGGTIDKHYNAVSGRLDVGGAVITQVLKTAGVETSQLHLTSFLQKDSLDITEPERLALARLVSGSRAQRILVTHGTDTLQATAEALARTVQNKTVVLTGAMVPHRMDGSDAAFNIGVAYAAVQLLSAGIYIAMHGRVLPHTQYLKDRKVGRFIAQEGKV